MQGGGATLQNKKNERDGKMKQNISINNGNTYVSAEELTDEQVQDIIDWLSTPCPGLNSDEENAARYEADGAETDREWIARYAESLGELVIG